MADLSQYSDEQLLQLAGQAGSAPSSNLGSYSNEDLLRLANVEPQANEEPKGFLESTWEGIKSAPGDMANMVRSIPDGVSNVYNSLFSPIESIESGVTEKTLRGVGKGASGVAGAGAGAIAGSVLAPFTFGASIPAGAAIGAASGMLGFDWLNQATGSDEATTIEQDAESLGRTFGSGLATGAAIKGVQKTIQGVKAAPKAAEDLSLALERKSLGTRASDYGKVGDLRTILDDEGISTPVKAQLNELIKSEELGTSRNPVEMLKRVEAKSTELSTKINDVIKEYDQTNNAPALPEFNNSLKYLESGKVPADKVYSYLNDLMKLEEAIVSEGKGSLAYLQQQKIALGKSYNPADQVSSGFARSLYSDLKSSIERYAPKVKELNGELQKYKVVEPILIRTLKAEEAASPLSKLRDIVYTTGGIGAPTIAGGVFGGPGGAVLGAGAGLLGKYLASPSGQSLVARAINASAAPARVANKAASKVGQASPSINKLFSSAVDAKQSSVIGATQGGREASLIKDLFSTEETMSTPIKGNIDRESLYKAVVKQESGGKSDAVSEVGAKGLMQLMDKTGKELFSKYKKELPAKASPEKYDPFNKDQNKILGSKYLDELLERYDGDPELALTAYHSGMGRVDKLLAKNDGTRLADIIDDLGPVGQKYARQVLSKIG